VPFRGPAATQVPAATTTLNSDVWVIAVDVTPTADGGNGAILGSLPSCDRANGLPERHQPRPLGGLGDRPRPDPACRRAGADRDDRQAGPAVTAPR
jgi:hypothetical protein